MEYIDLKINYTKEEMYEYEKSYLIKKYFGMYRGLPGIIIAGALAYFIVIAAQHGIDSIGSLPIIVFGILVLALLLVMVRVLIYRLTYEKRYEGAEILKKETRIVLSADGKYPKDIGDTPVYEEALDFFESKNLMVVEVGDENGRRALIIPKRYVNSQEQKSLVRDCAARMIKTRKDKYKKKKQEN